MDDHRAEGQWWTRRAFLDTVERMALVAADARHHQGWTARQLADRAGVPVHTIRGIESGRGESVSLDDVHRVFTALGVKILAVPTSMIGRP